MRTSVKFSAIAIAGAVALSGLAAAAPANADPTTATIILDNSTFDEGSWGAGLTGTGTGFSPNVEVHLQAWNIDDNGAYTSYGPETLVTSDAAGSIVFSNYVPASAPLASGLASTLEVTYIGPGAVEAQIGVVELTILPPFVQAEPSITVTPTCSTVDQIMADGVLVTATGFGRGEAVTDSLVGPDGFVFDDASGIADETGTVEFPYTLTGDGILEGTYTETVTGEAGLVLSQTFTVGPCTVVVPPVVSTPSTGTTAAAGATLAATGSTVSGPLFLGTVILLLAGMSTVLIARRRAA